MGWVFGLHKNKVIKVKTSMYRKNDTGNYYHAINKNISLFTSIVTQNLVTPGIAIVTLK